MKTKLVYILTSTPKDIYLEQMYVSMFSAKHYVPDAHIVLLTDMETKKTFTGVREKEIQYADEVIAVDLDPRKFNGQQRSRQLKTSARNLVDGDFLFVDCDTIICKPLNEIDSFDFDIAACEDTHSEFQKNPYKRMCIRHGKLLGWPIENETVYFNSGIIYVKDNERTREFYKRWNENLLAGYSKHVSMDQPSFAKTNYEFDHIVKKLDDVYNCELKHGIRFLKDAKVIHYLCTNKSVCQEEQLFVMNESKVLEGIKEEAEIPDEVVKAILDPFEGLARVTHCFAGNDVQFFTTSLYKEMRMVYGRPVLFKMVNFIPEVLFRVVNKVNTIRKMRKK